MARKIPVRKHRGIRDPIKQKKEREEKLKHVVNAPPKANEKVPKKVRQLSNLLERVNEGQFGKNKGRRKKKCNVNPEGLPLINTQKFMTPIQPKEKVIPPLVQQPWETDRMFYQRFQLLTNDIIKEAQFEKKFKMKVVRDEKGMVETMEKAPENEVDKKGELMAKEAKLMADDPIRAKRMKKKAVRKAAAKAEKIMKFKNYKKMKKEKKRQKIMEKCEDAPVHDVVKFGDVVHRPPEIKVLPRKASAAPKDLRTLMFNQMLLEGKRKEEERNAKLKNKEDLNLKGKWKNLPAGHRRILEDQQQNAIAAYRLIKASNQSKLTKQKQ